MDGNAVAGCASAEASCKPLPVILWPQADSSHRACILSWLHVSSDMDMSCVRGATGAAGLWSLVRSGPAMLCCSAFIPPGT